MIRPSLGGIVMHVDRRPEARRLGRLQHRNDAMRARCIRLDLHGEVTEVDQPSFIWSNHEALTTTVHANRLPCGPYSVKPTKRSGVIPERWRVRVLWLALEA